MSKSKKKNTAKSSNVRSNIAPSSSGPTPQEINSLAATFNEGRFAEAEVLAQQMTMHFPNHEFGWKVIGAVYKQTGRTIESLGPMQKAVALSPNDYAAHNNVGVTYHALGRLNEAEDSFRQALQLNSNCSEAYFSLGNVVQKLGRLQEAENCYRKALQIKPNLIKGRYSLAQIAKVKSDDDNLSALIALDAAANNGSIQLSDEEAVFLHFALGKSYNDIGEYENAFSHYLTGCKLKRAKFNYNSASNSRYFKAIARVFDSTTMNRLHGNGNPSDRPIFVLGMPRSGTTLTEQIIASHPMVYGAGELPNLMQIAKRDITGLVYPENLTMLEPANLNVWATDYVNELQMLAPNARNVTDKMPENFLAVGLIHLMLPNAKIIHVKRNPVDTCLSCLTQLFTDDQPHTYDLTELGRYYANYAQLMAHWRELLPTGAFLEVQYEDIVADLEGQARRIIDYCGLDWNDACLDFHKTERSVSTASMSQVRQPIYRSSLERWNAGGIMKNFWGRYLTLLANLRPTGIRIPISPTTVMIPLGQRFAYLQ